MPSSGPFHRLRTVFLSSAHDRPNTVSSVDAVPEEQSSANPRASPPFIRSDINPRALSPSPGVRNKSAELVDVQPKESVFLPLWNPSNSQDPSANFHRRWGPPVPGGPGKFSPLISVPSVAGRLGRYISPASEATAESVIDSPNSRPRGGAAPTQVFSNIAPFVLQESQACCVLCQEDFERTDDDVTQTTPTEDLEDRAKSCLLKQLPCSHVFHEICLSGYLRSKARGMSSDDDDNETESSSVILSNSRAFLEPSFAVPSDVNCPACRRTTPTSTIRIGMKTVDVVMHNPILPFLSMFKPIEIGHKNAIPATRGRMSFNLFPGTLPIPFAPSASPILIERGRRPPAIPMYKTDNALGSVWRRLRRIHKGHRLAWKVLKGLRREGQVDFREATMRNSDGVWGCYILVLAVHGTTYYERLIEGRMFSAGHYKKGYARDSAAAWVLAGLQLEKEEAELLELIEQEQEQSDRRAARHPPLATGPRIRHVRPNSGATIDSHSSGTAPTPPVPHPISRTRWSSSSDGFLDRYAINEDIDSTGEPEWTDPNWDPYFLVEFV